MKRMKLIFTFIILATSLSFLYAGWDFVAGGYISDVNFVGNNGWAVLSEGLVIHTPDGGTTWEYQQTATTERLYDVSFVDNLEGWVTGNDGLIFHTTDGGNNWIQQNSSTTTNMQSICFTDALNGWAAGSYGEIVHTSDGGATWAPQTSGISSKIYSIYFVDALNGWAVAASDYIIHTTDGGATWVTQTNPTTDSMQDVIFYDANEGWATGLKKIIHTVDGGANWVAQTNPADENLYGIGMGDNNHLWVVGIDGEILTTSDGGTNWIEQSFSLDWFLGAYFEDNLTGWIVGSGGAIYKTTDGGTTWITQQTGTSSGLRRTVFVDDNNVWGCGTKGFIIHSDDGGLTWESKDSGFDDWIWDITFAPDLIHGWAAGDDQTGETPILATVDGGETWIQQLTGIYGDVVGIEAVSNTEVFAAAQDGIILHTTDGGTTWNQQTSGVTVDFKSIEMVSEDIGWAVGASGIIIYTNDGGTTWTQQTSGTTESIYDVSFVDLLNGWAVAYGGVILHTTDGGTTWSLQPSGTTDNFTRVSAIDLNEVWAIAGEGFHTTDGGLTWTAVPIPCSIGLWGVDFANSDVGVAMGNGGIVARYTSGVTLDPPQNLAVTETGYATWDAPLARDLLGYNVYLNGVFVDFTTDLFWQYDETALISGLIYMAGVSALYDEGESSVIEYEFTYVTATLDPPQNLFVDETGYATWEAPGGTGALWEQLANASAEGGISVQDFETAFDIYDAEGADEFIVPTGETWTINEVVVLGHYSAAGPCDLANVRFYEDAAGMPGTLLFEYLDVAANPDVDGNLDCFISDTPFTEGTYWVSVQGRLDFGTCGQWYWEKQAAPTIGYEFHWRNPGDGFGLGFTTWTTGSIPWPPPDYYDYNLSFALYGAVSDGKTTVVKNNINPSYKKSLEKPAKISQTKKPDISLLSRVPSISSSFSGGHSINSRDLLGYNVYLDGAFVDFTTDLFWQYTGLVNGQTYMAGVSAWYDEGESIIVEFEFTYLPGNPGIAVDPAFIEVILDPDEIVVVPLTITNTGTAELTYEITIVEYTSDEFRAKNHKVRNLTEIKPDPAFNESDPDHSSTHGPIIPATDDLFDWQFEWPVGVGGGEAGIETDGNYIYTTKWNGATFFRYAMDGTYIEEFSVTGCPGGIRDLAYDGTYFYGAAASNTVYEMDFDTQTVISTITAPIAVRAIAYDEDADGFWANNWSDAFTLFGRDGATLDSFPCGVFQSCYGLAWENQLDGGPYIWGYFQDGATLNQLVQIDIATGLEPGPNLDIGSIFNVGTGIAGGLCISDAFVPGTWTICGTSQNVIIWGVELCAGDEPWISVVPNIGTIPAGGFEIVDVILNATDLFDITKTADIVIANNAGDDVIVPVTMEVTGPAPFDPPENVEVDIYTGLVTWDPPGGTIYGDDFESYTVGEYLAVQSDDWTTWTNNPGSAEDALISDDYALSGTNSVKVDGTTDLVLIMDNYTSGAYSIALNMYIPTGYCGYYNLQKTNVPGTEWGFQIQFDVTGIASIDGGAAAACTFPFDFDTWMNFDIIVDLDSDLCEFYYDGTLMHSYQWTLGTFGTPGLNQLGGVNMYAWASAGNNPLYYFDDFNVSLVNAEPSDELTGYNVYLDDMTTPIAVNIPDLEYLLPGLVYNQTYLAGVSAVYDDPGESDIVEVGFIYISQPHDPPENLVATVLDYNDVHLEWEPPSGAAGGILAHHSGYDLNGIGTGAAADFMCAARFDAADLVDYYGSDLTTVNVHIRTTDFSYVAVKVWEGGSFGNPGTEVYSADITGSVLIEDWTEHTLTTPIPLVAGNEYWIGYDMSATGDHPASVDAGPAVPGKGDWMYYTGVWQEISVAFALDFNWCIEGVVGGGDEILMTTRVTQNNHAPRLRNMMSSGIPEALFNHSHARRIENNRDDRMLIGYNVFRDGDLIAYINDPNELTYDDLGLDGATYEYWVTAVYDNGESDPSNAEEVTVILYAPQNLVAIVQGINNVFLTWDPPGPLSGRDLDYYNLYKNGEPWMSNINSIFVLGIGLAAGTYTFNVTAVYDGEWESVFSNDATVTVEAGGIPLPLVTELNGNYPNPFNPDTRIKFSVHEAGNVRIDIFNSKGQKIRTLVNEYLSANFYNMVWDGKDTNGLNVSSGVYFYKMDAGKYTSTKKMILMK